MHSVTVVNTGTLMRAEYTARCVCGWHSAAYAQTHFAETAGKAHAADAALWTEYPVETAGDEGGNERAWARRAMLRIDLLRATERDAVMQRLEAALRRMP